MANDEQLGNIPKEECDPRAMWRIMRQWSMSLDGLGGANFSCTFPLSEHEVEEVLAWINLIRRQVTRFAKDTDIAREALLAETGKGAKS